MWYKNIAGRFFGLVTKHACVWQTVGQTYDSQDRASIAASRSKNRQSPTHSGTTYTDINLKHEFNNDFKHPYCVHVIISLSRRPQDNERYQCHAIVCRSMASMHMTGKVDLCGVHLLKFSPPVSPRFHGQLRVRGIIWPHSSAAAYCYRPSSYRTVVCPVCLSVCNVGVLCPNGWMDEDDTWHGGRSRPRSHCVRWGPSSTKGRNPQFSANVRCSQTVGWIKMPLVTEACLKPVLWVACVCAENRLCLG